MSDDLRGRVLGDFVVREVIGKGGFGTVYRCEQPLLGREAVVKVLHCDARDSHVVQQRFIREAQLASQLDHPYAAHVYAFGVDQADGLLWIAMEFVRGTTLDGWLRDRGPLPLSDLVQLIERLAEVIQTAHEHGIVHRDIKPSNIMVIERAGRLLPKLLDLGVAKLFDPGSDSAELDRVGAALRTGDAAPAMAAQGETLTLTIDLHCPPRIAQPAPGGDPPPVARAALTRTSAAVGSPPYMAPEQWYNAARVGPRADLYALGIVAYECLVGHRPFTAPTSVEFAELHRNAMIPPVGDRHPAALDAFFQRALAKRPDDRPASALELSSSLRIAAGIAAEPEDLPRLDDGLREAWLAGAPQPLAEAIAVLDAARNVHQARDAALELTAGLVRYLLVLSLAARVQVRGERVAPAVQALLRQLRRGDASEIDRVRLMRLLVRPFLDRPAAHPLPELVGLLAPDAEGRDALDPLLAIRGPLDRSGASCAVGSQLVERLRTLARVMRACAFLLDHALVLPRSGSPERWMGLRRQRRVAALVRGGRFEEQQPLLIDRDAKPGLALWPLVQVAAPAVGVPSELFVFDGRGRHGARLVAAPAGYERHDAMVWDWLGEHLIGEIEAPGADPNDERRPPYLGLAAFATSDADRFVGREREVDALLNRMRHQPLQIVVGASGAGKSSFVHAGVVPGLPAGWQAISLRPGAQPMAALVARLATAARSPGPRLAALDDTPAEVDALISRAAGDGTLVIVVDQLEELFTLCQRAEERKRFAALLVRLSSAPELPTRVLCTLRDDFLMPMEALAGLGASLSPALFLLGNPSRDELVRMIIEPAQRAGYELSDPDLARDMADVVADRSGALALLSFTASRLWDLRDRRFRQLTRKAYDAMGGVGGALGQHAESVFAGLGSDDQRIAHDAFRQLVTADGARVVLATAELRERLASSRAEIVIEKLVAARLLAVIDGNATSQIEITHEALIRAWPRLERWVREDVEDLRMHEQVRIAARQWDDRQRPRSLLWRDELLTELARWRQRPGATALTATEAAFAQASRNHAARVRWIRRTLASSAFAALVAAVLVLASITREARVQRRLAEERTTAAYVEQGRQALLDERYTEAALYLSAAARRGDRSPDLRFMLARATRPLQGEVARLHAISGRTWSAIVSPDGRSIVASDDHGARIWDASTGRLRFTLPHDDVVFRAGFDASGSRIVTAGADGQVRLWDAATGQLVRAFQRKGADIGYRVATLQPHGSAVAAVDTMGAAVDVWRRDDAASIASLPLGGLGVVQPEVAFSADGTWLAASGDRDIRIWDTRTWQLHATLPVQSPVSFAFDPSSAHLATTTKAGAAAIWDVASGAVAHPLIDHGERQTHVAYSPDGDLLVVTTSDGRAHVWRADGTPVITLADHRGVIEWAEFDPSSKLLVTGGDDGLVVVTDIASSHHAAVFEVRSPVQMVRFAPDARTVVSAAWDGTARIWKVDDFYQRWGTAGVAEHCGTTLPAQEDARILAVRCPQRGTQIWDTALDRRVAVLPTQPSSPVAVDRSGDRAVYGSGSAALVVGIPGLEVLASLPHPEAVVAVAISPTGRQVASASGDGTISLALDGITRLLAIERQAVTAIDFTPDGSRLVLAGRRLRVYDLQTARVSIDVDNTIDGQEAPFRALRFSSDGRRLLTLTLVAQANPPVLWDLTTGHKIATLTAGGQVFGAHFISGDRQLLTASGDGTARIWSASTGGLERAFSTGSSFLIDAAIDAERGWLVASAGDGSLRFWSLASQRLIWSVHAHRGTATGIHLEGAAVISRGWNADISRWELGGEPDLDEVARCLRCSALQFDETSGLVVERSPAC
jgi:WD40 repeat protein/serine/threonine protein kinase